jgi:hypothetical protein
MATYLRPENMIEIFYYSAAVMILLIGITLFASKMHYRSLTDATLKKLSHPELLERMTPYGSTCEPEEVWKAMGGKPGVWAILRSMRAMRERAARLAHDDNDGMEADATQIMAHGLLGIELGLRTIVEAWMHGLYPGTPRTYACALARLYVEMAATMDALDSIHSYTYSA